MLQAIKDYHLFGMIGIMLVIDVVLLVIWTAIFPLEKTKVSRRKMVKYAHDVIKCK